jgi:hypothetical protein
MFNSWEIMIIHDEIYGDEEVKESVLLELINSKAMQRLKGVSQHGIPEGYTDREGLFSRYEHSLGVLIILRRLNAGIEEQISGLLHDVSHTAFSHVIDWAVGDPTKEDYQDNSHLEIIKNSGIKEILEKYGFNYEKISDIESFSLLEKDAPGLCADRIDYTLRELGHSGKKEEAYECFKDLINIDGEIAFKRIDIAGKFAYSYMRLQKEHWGGNQARAGYYLLSGAIKRAIETGIISEKDFMKTDSEVIEILENSEDSEIIQNLKTLKNFETFEDENGLELKKKFRYIDPEIFLEGKIVRLSEIDEDYKKKLEEEKSNSGNYKKVKIVPKSI